MSEPLSKVLGLEKREHAKIDGITPDGRGPHRFAGWTVEIIDDFIKNNGSLAPFYTGRIHCYKCVEDAMYNQALDDLDQLSPDVHKLADILYDQFDIALVEKQLEDLINQKHSSTIMEIQTIRGTAKIQCVRIAQEIINKMGKWIKKG